MANGAGLGGGAAGQEFCLKWNNHRTTIISVMDTLLEEESLVDVTLSADGQFIRAHRVILSACSPYFRQLFKSSFLNDKHPVIIMKDVDFDNLKSLVEYMYKGEANVPQHMLPSFIQTAESLQIRGLAEGASKQKLEQVAELNTATPHLSVPNIPVTPQTSLPSFSKSDNKKTNPSTPDSILAARLKTMVENPPLHMLDFHEQLALAARQSGHNLGVPPPMNKENKKRRKMELPHPNPNTSSPVKPDSNGHKEISVKKDLMSKNARLSPKISQNIMSPTSVNNMVSNLSLTNNNDESDSDVLKIDEDGDKKENSDKDDDIAEVDNGYGGMDDSEEEITMDNEKRSGVGFINPWTGEEMPGLTHVSHDVDHDEDSLQDGGLMGWPLSGGDYDQYGEEGPPGTPPPGHASPTNRLKRLTNTDSVYTMCQTPDGPKFQCAMCARIFNLKCTLLRHVRHQHQGRFVPHPCKTCGQVFKRTDHLKVHMKKIHNLSVKNPIPQTSVPAIMAPSPTTLALP